MPATTLERTTHRPRTEADMAKKKPGKPPAELDLTTWTGLVAERLRSLREKKFATQSEFAEALAANGMEITQVGVSGWESARRVPRVQDFPIIALTLGVSVRALLPHSPPGE